MLTDDDRDSLRTHLPKALGAGGRLTCRQAAQIAAATNLPLRKVEYFALEEGIVPERYDRNIGTVGLDGQRRLLASRAAVVGLGGLGGYVLEALSRLGVGQIIGVDGDVFVDSNLNRQLLLTVDNLGESKVEQARLRVSRINPAVEFSGHAAPVDLVGDEIVRDCDLVFDCLDSIEARRLLAQRCASAGVALAHGAIAGWCAQVGICPPAGDMFQKLYAGDRRGIEQRLGNLPFTAAVAANLMVAKAVPVLLGRPTSTRQRLLFFDLLEGDWETIEL